MRSITHRKNHWWVSSIGLVVTGLLVVGIASCKSPHDPTVRTEPNLAPGFPRPNPMFTQVSYQEVKAATPTIQGAEYVNDDEICADLPRGLRQGVRRTTCIAATAANRATGRRAATWKPAARSRG